MWQPRAGQKLVPSGNFRSIHSLFESRLCANRIPFRRANFRQLAGHLNSVLGSSKLAWDLVLTSLRLPHLQNDHFWKMTLYSCKLAVGWSSVYTVNLRYINFCCKTKMWQPWAGQKLVPSGNFRSIHSLFESWLCANRIPFRRANFRQLAGHLNSVLGSSKLAWDLVLTFLRLPHLKNDHFYIILL